MDAVIAFEVIYSYFLLLLKGAILRFLERIRKYDHLLIFSLMLAFTFAALHTSNINAKYLLVDYREGIQPMYRFDLLGSIHENGAINALSWIEGEDRLAAIVNDSINQYDANTLLRLSEQIVLKRIMTGRSLAFIDKDKFIIGGDGLSPNNSRGNTHALTIWKAGSMEPADYIPKVLSSADKVLYKPQDTFSVSSSGKTIASSDLNGNKLYLYNLSDLSLIKTVDMPFSKKPIPQFSPNSEDGKLEQDWITSLSFSPDQKTIAICSGLGNLYLVNSSGLIYHQEHVFPVGVRCTSLAFSADGNYLAIGREALHIKPLGREPRPGDKLQSEDNAFGVVIIKASDMSQRYYVKDFSGSIRDIAWSYKGSTIAIADDSSLRIMALSSDMQFAETQRFPNGTSIVRFAPSGYIAAVQNGNITIYKPDRM